MKRSERRWPENNARFFPIELQDHSGVRFTPECVAKLFAALRTRNSRILLDGAANQHCAFSSDVESIFRPPPPKIVLQHISP